MANFRRILENGRNHIVVLLGLLTAGGLFLLEHEYGQMLLGIEDADRGRIQWESFDTSRIPVRRERRELAPSERKMAETAWAYFVRNTDRSTGLAHAMENYPFTTLWDAGSQLLALISAERLGLIDRKDFHLRVTMALSSLSVLPLFEDGLPNHGYSTEDLSMVDAMQKPSESGTGWSAVEIGRLLVPLVILQRDYDGFTPWVRKVIRRWKLDRVYRNGALHGMGRFLLCPEAGREGSLGFEEYAAKAGALLAKDTTQAIRYLDRTGKAELFGVPVPVDLREECHSPGDRGMMSEPYFLDGLEFGWDVHSLRFGWQIFEAQRARHETTGQVTAVSETGLDGPPYRVWNTLHVAGDDWVSLAADGSRDHAWKTIGTHAAVAWSVLFETDYGRLLGDTVRPLFEPDRGFYSGIYEADGRMNRTIECHVNAVILESLHYLRFGPLLNGVARPDRGDG